MPSRRSGISDVPTVQGDGITGMEGEKEQACALLLSQTSTNRRRTVPCHDARSQGLTHRLSASPMVFNPDHISLGTSSMPPHRSSARDHGSEGTPTPNHLAVQAALALACLLRSRLRPLVDRLAWSQFGPRISPHKYRQQLTPRPRPVPNSLPNTTRPIPGARLWHHSVTGMVVSEHTLDSVTLASSRRRQCTGP